MTSKFTDLYPAMPLETFWDVLANEFDWDYYKVDIDPIGDEPPTPEQIENDKSRQYHALMKSLVVDEPMKFGPIYTAWQNHKYKMAPEPSRDDFFPSA